MNGDKREIAGCRCNERGSQHVTSKVVLVRDFEREHRASGRRLGDGRHSGRGAGHEKKSPSVAPR